MNNPFQKLDKTKFPTTKNSAKAQKVPVASQPQLSDEESSEQELFLRAMSNVSIQYAGGQHAHRKDDLSLKNQIIIPKTTINATKTDEQALAHQLLEAGDSRASETAKDEFLDAMREVTPLAGSGRSVNPAPVRKTAPQIAQDLMASFMEGKLEFALSNTKEYCEGYVVGLDEMTMNKLRAGAFSPEAHLDLHGLNTVQAFEAMRNFMRGSWYKSLRTILIIPGRGQNSPNGIGILRTKVQDWLTQEPFKRIVLAFCTAQQLDGGLGSLYVLLRKYKKKGRVYWERTPNDVDLNELA